MARSHFLEEWARARLADSPDSTLSCSGSHPRSPSQGTVSGTVLPEFRGLVGEPELCGTDGRGVAALYGVEKPKAASARRGGKGIARIPLSAGVGSITTATGKSARWAET